MEAGGFREAMEAKGYRFGRLDIQAFLHQSFADELEAWKKRQEGIASPTLQQLFQTAATTSAMAARSRFSGIKQKAETARLIARTAARNELGW